MTKITKPRRPRKMAREPHLSTAVATEAPSALAEKQPPASLPQRQTKASLVMSLLGGEGGATLGELCEVTGWLPHTARAFLSGLRKQGKSLDKTKRDDGITAYQLMRPEGAA